METELFMKTYQLGIVMGLVISAIMIIAVYLCEAFAYKGCMKKAGVETWKAFVPVYNLYTMYKIVKLNGWFIIFKIGSIIVSIISLIICASLMGDMEDFVYKIDTIENNESKSYTEYIDQYDTYSTSKKSKIEDVLMDEDMVFDDVDDLMDSTVLKVVPLEIISSIFSIGGLVAAIFFAIKIREAYKLPGGFIAGMILVPIVFNFIIGYGKYEYQYEKAGELKNL